VEMSDSSEPSEAMAGVSILALPTEILLDIIMLTAVADAVVLFRTCKWFKREFGKKVARGRRGLQRICDYDDQPESAAYNHIVLTFFKYCRDPGLTASPIGNQLVTLMDMRVELYQALRLPRRFGNPVRVPLSIGYRFDLMFERFVETLERLLAQLPVLRPAATPPLTERIERMLDEYERLAPQYLREQAERLGFDFSGKQAKRLGLGSLRKQTPESVRAAQRLRVLLREGDHRSLLWAVEHYLGPDAYPRLTPRYCYWPAWDRFGARPLFNSTFHDLLQELYDAWRRDIAKIGHSSTDDSTA
jgi:hypothetical protein